MIDCDGYDEDRTAMAMKLRIAMNEVLGCGLNQRGGGISAQAEKALQGLEKTIVEYRAMFARSVSK